MARKIFDTEKLFDGYFTTRPQETARKIRGQLDRKELYEYEQKIGKPLVDMDSMEIANMLISFKNKSFTKKNYKVSFRTYDSMLSVLRDFFDWYIDNYEVIKNPCNDKRIRGKNALLLYNDKKDIFTKESMEEIIEGIRSSKVEEYADYDEAIIRMFYEGFPESLDIVNLKTNEVNHGKQTVMVRGKEIKITDRLHKLLMKINKYEYLPAYRGQYVLLSYRDSYFKFPTREKFIDEFQQRPPEYWAGHISRLFNRDVKGKNDVNINARTLYLLGFYDFMIGKIGTEKAEEIINSTRNPNDTKILVDLADEYGMTEKNPTTLKKLLMQFIQ